MGKSMPNIKWLPVLGYEGKYEVSNTGLIKSLNRVVNCSTNNFNRSRFVSERILKQVVDRYGYSTVGLNNNSEVKWHKVHRLVMQSFIGQNKLTVNHKDLNKQNNNLSNLEYLSSKDNINHFNNLVKRSLPTGSNHYNSKLTDTDRVNIIAFKEIGIDYRIIANSYGISPNHVFRVVKKGSVG